MFNSGSFNRLAFNRNSVIPVLLKAECKSISALTANVTKENTRLVFMSAHATLVAKSTVSYGAKSTIISTSSLSANVVREQFVAGDVNIHSTMHNQPSISLVCNTYSNSMMLALMQSTLQEALNAPERYILPKIEIYFDGIQSPPVLFTYPMVDEITLLEELKFDNSSPLGAVSANELTLSLANIDRQLSPTNKQGTYYGKIVPNVPIKFYLQVFTSVTDTFYYDVPLGTFYISSWDDFGDSPIITVTAYDKMATIGMQNITSTKVLQNVAFTQLFEFLFAAINLTNNDYIIDPYYDSVIVPMGWLPQGTFMAAANWLVQACNAFMFLDRDNKIVVKHLDTTIGARRFLTDQNQITGITIPTSYTGAYSQLQIVVSDPAETDPDVLLAIDMDIPSGITQLDTYVFNQAPISYVSSVQIDALHTSITSYTASCFDINIIVNNTADVEHVQIKVYGQALALTKHQINTEDSGIKSIIGEKMFKLENTLIQKDVYAHTLSDDLFPILRNPQANMIVNIRGNPTLMLGDIVSVDDASDKVEPQNIIIYRRNLHFAGGLSETLQGYNIT